MNDFQSDHYTGNTFKLVGTNRTFRTPLLLHRSAVCICKPEEEKLKKEQYLKHYRRKEKTTGIDGNFLIAYNKKVGFKHRMFISYIRCSFCKY